MPKKLLLSIAAVAAAFSLAACGADGDDADTDDAAQSQEQGEQAMPEPELDDIPDVVAVVNGEEISGESFSENYESQYQQLTMQAQMTGEEPDQEELKSQALDMMINSELLVAKAEDEGFSASEDDIDEYLDSMAEENGLESADALQEEFEAQGLSEDRVREDIQKEVLIEQVIDTIDIPEPSDDELQAIYDMQVEQLETMNEQVEEDQAQEVPSFEELEPELEEQAVAQKENEAVTELLEDLREDADIETHIYDRTQHRAEAHRATMRFSAFVMREKSQTSVLLLLIHLGNNLLADGLNLFLSQTELVVCSKINDDARIGD